MTPARLLLPCRAEERPAAAARRRTPPLHPRRLSPPAAAPPRWVQGGGARKVARVRVRVADMSRPASSTALCCSEAGCAALQANKARLAHAASAGRTAAGTFLGLLSFGTR